MTTLPKSKQLPFLRYQKSDQMSKKQNKKKQQKFGFRAAFQTGPNLKNVLCKNKDKLIPNSYPGVYELKCSCGSVHNSETKKKIICRSIEHQQESIKGNRSFSGTTEHIKQCHGHPF